MRKCDKDRVFEAYDEIVSWFDSARTKDLSLEKFYLDYAKKHLPVKGKILDLGCGMGEPIAKFSTNLPGVNYGGSKISGKWDRL